MDHKTTYRDTLRRLGIVISSTDAYACEFLEAHGFVFGVNFGYENALAKATEVFALKVFR